MHQVRRIALAIVAIFSVKEAQRPIVTFVAGLLLLAALSLPATAATYYMAPNGSDSGAGTITSPWRTFSFASGRLKPGDTLFARGGTYTGQRGSWSSPSGTSSAPITWKAYPGETPVFDGQNANINFLNVTAKDWIIFDGMTIKNYRGCCGAIWIGYSGSGTDYAENNAIRNMTITDIGASSQTHGIYCSYGNRNLEISGNLILRTSGASIHCYHSPGVVNGKIFNNVIAHGNQYSSSAEQWGMVLRNGFSGEIYNNTVIDNQRDIDLGGSGAVTVRNNIISKPLTSPQSGTTRSHNMCLSGTCNGGTGSFTTSGPGFVNAGADNYRLKGSGPAIDAGTSVPVGDDHDGNSRPAGAAYDIGAFEFDNGTPDTEPPSVPTGVTALAESASKINVSWAASIDDVGVTGYEVQRGGAPRATVTGTFYSDTGLAAGTTYGYRIRARDAAGNWSALSSTGAATTDQAGTPTPGRRRPAAERPHNNGVAHVRAAWRQRDRGRIGRAVRHA